MKKIIAIVTMTFALVSFAAQAQDTKSKTTDSKKQSTNKSQNSDSNKKNAGSTDASGNNDELNSNNNPDNGNAHDNNGTGKTEAGNNYRSNRKSGNPNNVSVDEGSNRETSSSPAQTNETSGADNGGQGGKADPQASNAPTVIEETSSQSGSPAVLSGTKGEERDGTNNIQRAKPNMAGSSVNGLKIKNVDEDKEIRKKTDQPQQNAQTPAASKTNNSKSKKNSGASSVTKPVQHKTSANKKSKHNH
jgi:hypothetical protein